MRGFRRCWSVLPWALAWCTCWPCSLWAATPETYGIVSSESAPDWLELRSNLDEIEDGLRMIELPLSEIERRLIERERELSETEQRLLLREQALSEREQGLSVRESFYAGMEVDLEAAKNRLRRSRWWAAGALVLGIAIGYMAHR